MYDTAAGKVDVAMSVLSKGENTVGSRKVVTTGATFPEEAMRQLHAAGFDVDVLPGDLDEGTVVQALQDAWGYVLGGSERMSKDAWDRLPELAVVCFLGTGYSAFMEVPDGESHTSEKDLPGLDVRNRTLDWSADGTDLVIVWCSRM